MERVSTLTSSTLVQSSPTMQTPQCHISSSHTKPLYNRPKGTRLQREWCEVGRAFSITRQHWIQQHQEPFYSSNVTALDAFAFGSWRPHMLPKARMLLPAQRSLYYSQRLFACTGNQILLHGRLASGAQSPPRSAFSTRFFLRQPNSQQILSRYSSPVPYTFLCSRLPHLGRSIETYTQCVRGTVLVANFCSSPERREKRPDFPATPAVPIRAI